MSATFVDIETGEQYEGPCPNCAEREQWAEAQVRKMEMERRGDRAKVTRMENAAERDLVRRRDGATWEHALEQWLAAFPDKRPSSKSIKSARATKFFQRLEAGATPDDVDDAIRGAKAYPYVVYGKRVKSGSKSDLANDLEDIVAVNSDRQFDALVEIGRALREQTA